MPDVGPPFHKRSALLCRLLHSLLSPPVCLILRTVSNSFGPCSSFAPLSDVLELYTGTRASAPNSSGTPQGLRGNYQPSLSAETVNSRLMAVHRGQSGLPSFGLSIAGRWRAKLSGKRERTL